MRMLSSEYLHVLSSYYDCILLEYLALGGAWVSHNTDIDIPSEVCFLCCDFRNATKQHKKHPTFDLIIS